MKRYGAVDEAYFEWLCNQIDYYEGDMYDDVIYLLHDTDYRYYIANDDNRAADGIELRRNFMYEEGWYTEPLGGGECTCLEFFIALAKRIEDDIMWDGEHDRTSEWFWMMLRNLGLLENHFYDILEERLDNFLDRNYSSDGFGGIFPVKGCTFDQTEAEIWSQMQYYMMKNYEF